MYQKDFDDIFKAHSDYTRGALDKFKNAGEAAEIELYDALKKGALADADFDKYNGALQSAKTEYEARISQATSEIKAKIQEALARYKSHLG